MADRRRPGLSACPAPGYLRRPGEGRRDRFCALGRLRQPAPVVRAGRGGSPAGLAHPSPVTGGVETTASRPVRRRARANDLALVGVQPAAEGDHVNPGHGLRRCDARHHPSTTRAAWAISAVTPTKLMVKTSPRSRTLSVNVCTSVWSTRPPRKIHAAAIERGHLSAPDQELARTGEIGASTVERLRWLRAAAGGSRRRARIGERRAAWRRRRPGDGQRDVERHQTASAAGGRQRRLPASTALTAGSPRTRREGPVIEHDRRCGAIRGQHDAPRVNWPRRQAARCAATTGAGDGPQACVSPDRAPKPQPKPAAGLNLGEPT